MSASPSDMQSYDDRLTRYRTAMANGKPDRIPIRPFVTEFTAKVAGMTNQEVTQDYEKAVEAARICARTFDRDAVVPNMVYLWGGISQMLGTRYYMIPGVGIGPDTVNSALIHSRHPLLPSRRHSHWQPAIRSWCRMAWPVRTARWNRGPLPNPHCPKSSATKRW